MRWSCRCSFRGSVICREVRSAGPCCSCDAESLTRPRSDGRKSRLSFRCRPRTVPPGSPPTCGDASVAWCAAEGSHRDPLRRAAARGRLAAGTRRGRRPRRVRAEIVRMAVWACGDVAVPVADLSVRSFGCFVAVPVGAAGSPGEVAGDSRGPRPLFRLRTGRGAFLEYGPHPGVPPPHLRVPPRRPAAPRGTGVVAAKRRPAAGHRPRTDPRPARHGVASASVGESREARTAGYRPASPPITSVAATPPARAQAGTVAGQPW